jgi:hypothetical protein
MPEGCSRRRRGFPWLAVAGKTLTGWLVIDMDATLVAANSDKEEAAPTWKMGYGFHLLAAWCANTRECLNMLLRPGNARSNTFTDHNEVLTAALRQVPARRRRKILVRVDGAGASHDLIGHLLSLSSPRGRRCCSPAAGPSCPPTRTPSPSFPPSAASRTAAAATLSPSSR